VNGQQDFTTEVTEFAEGEQQGCSMASKQLLALRPSPSVSSVSSVVKVVSFEVPVTGIGAAT
jgi:hypothetical protein